MLYCKLALLIVETLTSFVINKPQFVGGFGFHLNCHLLHLNAKAEFCTKRFMGPGVLTRRSRRIRDVSVGLIKSINGTRISIATKDMQCRRNAAYRSDL